MCKKQTEETIDFSDLNGRKFIMNVDRIASGPDVQYPEDVLREDDYTLTDEDIRHEVTFSEDGQEITIEPGPVKGVRTKVDEGSLYYQLGEGLFAGGRFVIWIDKKEFEAEMTIYGSGIPVIRSERGILESKKDYSLKVNRIKGSYNSPAKKKMHRDWAG